MRILNATPDSFTDGGEHLDPDRAADAAARAVEAGADLLDVGGESTRPGADAVDEAGQIARVVPVIEAIRARGIDVPITVDTTRSAVADAALSAGVDAVNDVSGGRDDPDMLELVAQRGVGVVLMHRLHTPARDSYSNAYETEPTYEGGVVAAVRSALAATADAARAAGVHPDGIVLDPGLGFGKSVAQNLDLLRGTPALLELGYPVLSGLSRKSFVGAALAAATGVDRPPAPADRVWGSVGLSVTHLGLGASIFRVHDVGEHREALDTAWAGLGGVPDANRPAG